MLALIQFHGPTLAICVGLGVATSWWMFKGDTAKTKKGDAKP